MNRGLLLALIGGIASAVLPLGFLAPAPVFAVGFYLGSAFAGISAGVAALVVLVNMGGNSAILYIVGIGVPSLLIIHQAMISQPGPLPNTTSWYPAGQILASLSVYGVLVLVCLAAFFATTGNTMETAAQGLIKDAAVAYTNSDFYKQLPGTEQDMATKLIDLYTRVASPTFVGIAFSYFLLVLIAIAAGTQGLLVRAGQALRPSPSYLSIELPRWLTGALAIMILLTLLPGVLGSFGLNAALFLSTPFFLLGLTVIHTLSRRVSMPGLVLTAFYLVLFLFGVLSGLFLPFMALLVLLGIGEQWFSLRQRFAAPGANQEDE